jgi:cell division protein FtsQ
LFKRRKIGRNQRKRRKTRRRLKIVGAVALGIKVLVGVATVSALTGVFIMVHDVLTQCDFFRAKTLTIVGAQRLTQAQVARHARVHIGINILAVNLSLTRKRLLAHPWIANAEVSREIPSGIRIGIREHAPLAVIELGRRFLMNRRGEIFKEWDIRDPAHLPAISGLELSDFGEPGPKTSSDRDVSLSGARPLEAVMQVLRLGARSDSILPNRFVKRIQVDRQMGLTLFVFDGIKIINLGYGDFTIKYHTLANFFRYLKRRHVFTDFKRIDLNNVNRVVVHPNGAHRLVQLANLRTK